MKTPPGPAQLNALGWAWMDQDHQELLELAQALSRALPSQVGAALQGLLAHLRHHFAAEEAEMERAGFPALQCHREEHDRVLVSLEGAVRRLAGGEVQPARNVAGALLDWLPAHVDYMDAPLAHWLSKRQFGGVPVVMQRRLTVGQHLQTQSTEELHAD